MLNDQNDQIDQELINLTRNRLEFFFSNNFGIETSYSLGEDLAKLLLDIGMAAAYHVSERKTLEALKANADK